MHADKKPQLRGIRAIGMLQPHIVVVCVGVEGVEELLIVKGVHFVYKPLSVEVYEDSCIKSKTCERGIQNPKPFFIGIYLMAFMFFYS